MTPPQFFNRTTFAKIPQDPGIYAFFLDFEYILRAIDSRATPTVDLVPFIEKAIRARTIANPKSVGIRLHNRSTFTSVLTLETTHNIRYAPPPTASTAAEIRTIAGILDKCTMFSAPLYIGITARQDLYKRFKQHKKKYEHYKKSLAGSPRPKGRAVFDRGERFYHRLVRRQIEFRDLLFACIPLSAGEITHVKYVERLLHAFVAPVMSDA